MRDMTRISLYTTTISGLSSLCMVSNCIMEVQEFHYGLLLNRQSGAAHKSDTTTRKDDDTKTQRTSSDTSSWGKAWQLHRQVWRYFPRYVLAFAAELCVCKSVEDFLEFLKPTWLVLRSSSWLCYLRLPRSVDLEVEWLGGWRRLPDSH
jgi:hypothetical protein